MLIYKNVDKCSTESYAGMQQSFKSRYAQTFLKFERCVNLTFKEYDEKEYINDNIALNLKPQ